MTLRPVMSCAFSLAAMVAAPPVFSDVSDAPPVALKFSEFYKLPVGPAGLEPTVRLLALDGRRVRLLGYVARQAEPVAGIAILAPMPLTLGDEDESFADDLPASSAYVHHAQTVGTALAEATGAMSAHGSRLCSVVGTLELGPRAEADGRVSQVRPRAESAECGPPPATAARRRD